MLPYSLWCLSAQNRGLRTSVIANNSARGFVQYDCNLSALPSVHAKTVYTEDQSGHEVEPQDSELWMQEGMSLFL